MKIKYSVILAAMVAVLLISSATMAGRRVVGTTGYDSQQSSDESESDGRVVGTANNDSRPDGYVVGGNANNVRATGGVARARASVTINNPTKVIYRTNTVRKYTPVRTVRTVVKKIYVRTPAPKPVVIIKKVIMPPAKPVEKERKLDKNMALMALYGTLGVVGIVALVVILALFLGFMRRRGARVEREQVVAEREVVRNDANDQPILNAPQGRFDAQTIGGVDFRSDAAFAAYLASLNSTIEFQDSNAAPPPTA